MSTHPVKHRNVTARPLAVALLAVVLDACALDPTYPDAPPPPGSTAVSIIGTPFLIAFKIPACAATLAIGAPLAAATELGDPD